MKVEFESRDDLRAMELAALIGNYLLDVVDWIERDRPFIGHAKAFVRTPLGHIQANLVDTELGPETVQVIREGAITSGSMNLMAVAIGSNDRKVEESMRKALEPLDLRLKMTVHEHEHGETNDSEKMISWG